MTRGVLIRNVTSLRGAGRAARLAPLLLLALALAHLAAERAWAAAPLAEYRVRVREAIEAVETMAYAVEGEEAGAGLKADAPYFWKTTARVRELLPPTEQVESAGATVVVNNAWLHALLDDYGKSAERLSAEERAATLWRIDDRLHALDARLAEAEGAAAQAAARDKDAEKGRLAAILRGKEYNREAAEGGALSRLLERIADAIASLFPDVRPVSRGGGARASRVVQYVIFALALAVVAYVARRYWVRRRDRVRAVKPREARVVLGERIEADRSAADLLTEAELLAREGDLRGAIRRAYVALLCELGDRKVIRLAQHKTNRDYLRDARRDAPPRLYEEMRPLTDGFERHWYGLEEADQTDWADYRTRCREAIKKV